MSSETDHPRQRTVAELLAEHGNAGATGRRRRRREADGPGQDATPPAPVVATGSGAPAWQPKASPVPDRAILREPVPQDAPLLPRRASRSREVWPLDASRDSANGDVRPLGRGATTEAAPRQAQPRDSRTREAVGSPRSFAPEQVPAPERPVPLLAQVEPAALLGQRPPPDLARDRPTDEMPRIQNAAPGVLDPGLTGPIETGSIETGPIETGPIETGPIETGPGDYGRPTEPAPEHGRPDVDAAAGGEGDEVAAAAAAPGTPERRTRASRRAAEVGDAGPPTQAGRPPFDFDAFDDHPAGLGADSGADGPGDGDGAVADTTTPRRVGRTAAGPSTSRAWMAVVAQWIIGAVGGAALWVGFRFLWHDLPVVALAAAVLITVGLVLVVRSLLRNNDLRTTVFAVLVGLLLTVSPALLVLLGR